MMRWINSRVATCRADQLPEDAGLAIIDARQLVDKHGNRAESVREKMDEALEKLRSGENICVVCDYGMSRSNALAAGILAAQGGMPLEEALAGVVAATGCGEIKIEVLDVVREALGEPRFTGGPAARPRLAITGGGGFIGGLLRNACGGRLFAVSPARSEIDLLAGAAQLDAVIRKNGVSHLVHLASPRVANSTKSLGESLIMLRNALSAARENHCHFTYLSGWVLFSGYRAPCLTADEATPVFPRGVYPEAKMLAEQLIRHYVAAHDLRACVFRLPSCYGEGSPNPRFIHEFIRRAGRNLPIQVHRYRNGPPLVDLLCAADVPAAIITAVEKSAEGWFHLGRRDAFTTHQVAEKIIAFTGSQSSLRVIDIDDDAAGVVLDPGRAAKALGWKAETEFLNWLRDFCARRED